MPRARLTLAALGGLYLLVINLPELPLVMQPGLDHSWVYGINQAHVQGLRFGSQVVFTYGPLGYVLYPLDLGSNLARAVVLRSLLSVLTVTLAAIGVYQTASAVRAFLFLAAFTAALRVATGLAVGLQASVEYGVVFPVLLALGLALEARRHHLLALAATVLAAMALLMKLTLGAACAGSVAVYLLVQQRRGRLRAWALAAYAAVYAAAVAALFAATGNLLADLPGFLGSSLEIILGLSDAVSLAGPAVEVLLGVACVAVAAALALRARTGRLRDTALLSLPILLVAFKHGFVRHDLHAMNMFTAALGCFAVLVLFARTVTDLRWIATGIVVAAVGATAALATREQLLPSIAMFDPRLGLERLCAYADWTALRAQTAARSTDALQRHRLPPALQDRLRSGTVDVVPFDTSYVPANDLHWAPAPVFQSYVAYTAALDRLNAAHFSAPDGPDHVLYELKALEGRHPFLDNPAATRALLCHYVLDQREGGLLVLRRAVPRCGDLVPVGARTARWGEAVPVPQGDESIQVRLHIRYGFVGWVRQLLLRSPYVVLVMTYADGTSTPYRLLPAVARNGIGIANLPRGTDALEQLLSGTAPPAVRSFRVASQQAGWFQPEIRVEFERMAAAPAAATRAATATAGVADARLRHADAEPANWLTHGGNYAEQRFSRLDQLTAENVGRLQPAWSCDLPTAEPLEATPIAVDGVLFTTAAWSVVFAIDARTGRLLWRYDPRVPRDYVAKLCCGAVNRGVALYRGTVFVGTLDGRLVALDAASGRPRWEVMTVDPSRPYSITGAPRVVDGKVIIGNGGADFGVRGYVSAYDAESGALVWRTFTVPGDPARPFESPALARAAATWTGEWWKVGGGGTVWDAMAYDPDLDLLYVGTGNGAPWNRMRRSPGGGDNLYLSSILALRPRTGEMVWYFQETPGDTWDYAATQQMILADLPIDGRTRKTLLHAPKNGFFYVLDRETGALISARNYAEVTWASGIDAATGRPIEVPGADYREREFVLKPSTFGAHGWHPMAFSPLTGLVYIPVQEMATTVADDPGWSYQPGALNRGMLLTLFPLHMASGHLLAWDPVRQREVWRTPYTRPWNGGTLATAGNLVFQGTNDGRLLAARADTGKRLWQAAATPRVIAAPITYLVDGVQYVTVLASRGGILDMGYPQGSPPHGRVLSFALRE